MLVEEDINCVLFVNTCVIFPTVKSKLVLVERNVTVGRISDMIRENSAPQRGIEPQSLTVRVKRFSLTKDETHDLLLFNIGQIDLTVLITCENDLGDRLKGNFSFCVYL